MQTIVFVLCAFVVMWAFEIRNRESAEKIVKAAEDVERLKDELSGVTRQLKAVAQKLESLGLS